MDFLDFSLIRQGGPMMYPLLALSVIGFVLFIERTLYLHRGQIGTEDFLNGIKNLVRKRRLVEAMTLCEETPGPVAKIVKAALLNINATAERIRAAIQAAAMVEVPPLERRIGTIAAIARIAPLLGFLGTLVAALQALYQLESFNADSGRFAVLLAQALISSAFGLAIAIMGRLAHHFLYGRVRSLVHDFEWLGHETYQFLIYDLAEPAANDAEGAREAETAAGER